MLIQITKKSMCYGEFLRKLSSKTKKVIIYIIDENIFEFFRISSIKSIPLTKIKHFSEII